VKIKVVLKLSRISFVELCTFSQEPSSVYGRRKITDLL